MDKKPFTPRQKARIILYISTVFIVLGIVCIAQTIKANRYKQEAMITKQMALIALDENLNNISTNLEKTIYVTTPTMLSKLSAELWREASGAKANLSLLPTNEGMVGNTYKFLSQIGEFVMALERKTATGETLTDEEREQLQNLYSFCNSLSENINKICLEIQNGTYSFEEVKSTLTLNSNIDTKTFADNIDDTEQALTDVPTLIYDGPFSDHLSQGKAKHLDGLSNISKDEALEIAKKICVNEKDSLRYSHNEDGNIPCYVFQSDNCTVAITKQGGKPCYMLNSQFVGEVQLKDNDVIEKAKTYLEKIGYSNMKESYYFTEDGICTINFASKQNNIVMYPDLIKVSVSLENGEVLSFDATGYISNHTTRNNLSSKISLEQAKNTINNQLEILDTRLCFIPTECETEQLCYEIHCKDKTSREFLIYIDCETGMEDNILVLLYSDDGVLTK
ncbi:MAG: germination protein YpeB [Clostridia bacterium]|nr:germination protein YpeB [Clostridia bacterium]